MAKNILVLNGSPRKNGNTSVLLNWLEDELKQKKYELVRYDLYPMQFKGCSHCNACKRTIDIPGCVLQDNAIEILDAITQTDVIVMASPVYCWSFSGCMSALHDRMYCLFKNEVGGKSLFAGKKMVGIFTSAGDAFSGMQYCDAALKEMCLWAGANYLGTIGATKCTTPEHLMLQQNVYKEMMEFVTKF